MRLIVAKSPTRPVFRSHGILRNDIERQLGNRRQSFAGISLHVPDRIPLLEDFYLLSQRLNLRDEQRMGKTVQLWITKSETFFLLIHRLPTTRCRDRRQSTRQGLKALYEAGVNGLQSLRMTGDVACQEVQKPTEDGIFTRRVLDAGQRHLAAGANRVMNLVTLAEPKGLTNGL